MVAADPESAPEHSAAPAHLRPHLFTKENAAEMARRGAAASKATRARRRLERLKLDELVSILEELGDTAEVREELRATAFAGALALAGRLATGSVPDRHAHYVASAAEKLLSMARLESGEATSVGVSVTGGPGDWDRWLQDLRSSASTTPTATPPVIDA